MNAAQILDEVDNISSKIVGNLEELFAIIGTSEDNKELIAQCYANWYGIDIDEAREISSDALHFIKINLNERKRLLDSYLEALRNEAKHTPITKEAYYYAVRVNYDDCVYLIPIKSEKPLTVDEAIKYCKNNNLFLDAWDANYVDYFNELEDEEEYQDMKGCK